MKNTIALLLLAVCGLQVNAQTDGENTTLEQKLNTLADDVTDLKNDQQKRSQLKLTGYIHAQYQVADSEGIASYAAGNFAAGVDKRFLIRRGRVKLDYSRMSDEGDIMTQAIVQIDYSQNGLALRDAYVNVLDPMTKWFGLKVGAMDRPFSYELTYSSSVRETPERGRMSQILFPGEKDLGAQIYIMPNKTSRLRFFKLDAGFYNGTGVLNNDFDKYKDFISRLSFFKNNEKETIKYSGGMSYYNGGHRNGNKYLDVLQKAPSGNHFWAVKDSSSVNASKKGNQVYYGADAQVSIQWKGGLTTLRAEYIQGTQAGTASSSSTPREVVTTNTFQRNFNGAYFYFVQNIANSRHNIVVKYDWYDPNTDVKESEIGAVSTSASDGTVALNAADIKYSTLGLGYYFNYDQNWRFLLYADIVKNDPTKLTGYGTDLKDNVLTIRVQYKF
jgi:hypothetical protein